MQRKYLFVLSPPYSGSTVLWRLLQTAPTVSALPDEGQKLPELRSAMRDDPWNPDRAFDWGHISEVWHRYWDTTRPILLEKSPPHLCRPRQLLQHFQPACFILLLRDPLAVCEALRRRNGLTFDAGAARCVEWLRLYQQARALLPRTITVFYEDLVTDPSATFTRLARWLPDLAAVDPHAAVRSHAIDGEQTRPLTDLNPRKLAQVNAADRHIVAEHLRRYAELLAGTPYGLP